MQLLSLSFVVRFGSFCHRQVTNPRSGRLLHVPTGDCCLFSNRFCPYGAYVQVDLGSHQPHLEPRTHRRTRYGFRKDTSLGSSVTRWFSVALESWCCLWFVLHRLTTPQMVDNEFHSSFFTWLCCSCLWYAHGCIRCPWVEETCQR